MFYVLQTEIIPETGDTKNGISHYVKNMNATVILLRPRAAFIQILGTGSAPLTNGAPTPSKTPILHRSNNDWPPSTFIPVHHPDIRYNIIHITETQLV
jgi:hypothetical protein